MPYDPVLSVTACSTCVLNKAVKSCAVAVMKRTLQPVRRPESNWDPGGSSWTVVRWKDVMKSGPEPENYNPISKKLGVCVKCNLQTEINENKSYKLILFTMGHSK